MWYSLALPVEVEGLLSAGPESINESHLVGSLVNSNKKKKLRAQQNKAQVFVNGISNWANIV